MPFTAAARQIERGAKPLVIVGAYVALGAAWILVSDLLLHRLEPPISAGLLGTLKGLVFVAVTGAAMWALLAARQRRIDRAVEIIQQTGHDLVSLMDNTRDFVVRFDRDLRHVFVNRALCEAAGIPREEYLGKTNEQLGMPAEDCALWNAHLRRVFETGEEQSFEFTFIPADGARHDYMARVFPERDASGEVKTILSIVRDVTPLRAQERQTAAAKKMLERTFQALTDAVFIVEVEGRRIVDCNPAVERLFGYRCEEVVGQPTRILHVDAEHHEEFGRLSEEILKAEGWFRMEFQMRRRDGTVFDTEHTVTLIRDEAGEPRWVVSVVRDVTEVKRYQRNLRQSRDLLRQLAKRLGEREEINRRRFAQELHDRVGQSITVASLNLSLIERALATGDSAAARERLREAGDHLHTVSERIRDVIAELRPAVLDDYGLVPGLEELGRQIERRAGFAVKVSAMGLDDRLTEEMESVFYRIAEEALTNAAKHASASEVDIAVCVSAEMARLVIRDDGIGFDPGARRPDGRSWGLEIMRERALAVGGRLTVESTRGRGTTITVEIPRRP